ncbi:hypothetical protein AVEN_170307-1 [Araneus ventricosus]|uniref:Uncharacterized protein n=1 Tax=Araneus ventricosus TaxID=182803 RepID=A0A4Y2CBS0_ARAVE|nr:hypothetical protein AVEN_170307-1 [Araneus ventricosus]
MKPLDFQYGRKQETDDEKEENVILIEESEDEDFGSFQQEKKAVEMEEAIYLESSTVDFSTNMLVFVNNGGGIYLNTGPTSLTRLGRNHVLSIEPVLGSCSTSLSEENLDPYKSSFGFGKRK